MVDRNPSDMDEVDGLYLLASNTGIQDFFLVEENAQHRKESLEETYPETELDLALFEIEIERVE